MKGWIAYRLGLNLALLLERNHAFAFLGASALLLILSPVATVTVGFALAECLLLTVAVVAGALSMSLRGRAFLIFASLGLIWLGLRLFGSGLGIGPAPSRLLFALITGWIFVRLVRDLMRAREVDAQAVASALSGFLVLGIFWSQIYGLSLAILGPSALQPLTGHDDHSSLFYFSFSTLATVGYGDILPVHPMVRMLAVTEAVSGIFYNAVVIARLVSLYAASAPNERDRE